MKKSIILTIMVLTTTPPFAQSFNPKEQLDYCSMQVNRALEMLQPYDYKQQPRNILASDTHQGWNCRPAVREEWCSGFWPGILWMDYGYTHDPKVRTAAEGYTESLAYMADMPAYDHDLGFIVINSFLKGYEITQNQHYKEVALKCADELAQLYNPKVGTILSWPRHVKDYGGHNTIMDNMINLELLLWAAENGGSPYLKNIAISHAITTMRNHFRPDGSSYHVAVYDTVSGQFLRGQTHQGYADYSMWSRGQSWAIYGFTTMYKYTHDPLFLEFAQKVTDIYLKRLRQTCDDWVPIWDFDDPRGNNAPKDASTASIVASALIDLSKMVADRNSKSYHDAAISMLADLSTEKYQSRDKNVAFIMHSTGHHPAGSEIDSSIIYADYYYIEALLKLYYSH